VQRIYTVYSRIQFIHLLKKSQQFQFLIITVRMI